MYRIGFTLFALLLSTAALAAGQSMLSISLPTKVEAGRIDPLVVPAESVMHGRDIHIEEPFCVYSNDTESGDYQVTFSGSDENNDFKLTDGQRHIAYQVAFNDKNTSDGFVPVKASKTLGDQTAGNIQQYPCQIDNARIRLLIPSSEYEQLPAGTYTGALFVTVGED